VSTVSELVPHSPQDYESVKVSLESSERIRKQQKELINLLQRSHSLAVASDSGSVLSFNSISTISHHGGDGSGGVGNQHNGHTGSRVTEVSSASFAAENREWYASVLFPSFTLLVPRTSLALQRKQDRFSLSLCLLFCHASQVEIVHR